MKRAIDAIASAQRIAVLTGAGISAESGIPTFRDALTGLWARFRPEELATPEAFLADPRLVWDWYAWRRDDQMLGNICYRTSPSEFKHPGLQAATIVVYLLPR